MSSEPTTSVTPAEPRRLCLKADGPPTGFVDGAWWPGSRDLAAELPAVMAELSTRVGRVERVAYSLDAWPITPRKIRIEGAVVRMAGFHTLDADIVQMIGAQRTLTLLVVPPDTDQQTARDALTAASRADNTDDVEALLHTRAASEPARTS